MKESSDPKVSTDIAAAIDGEVVCKVTRWYFRRMGILGGMLFLMGVYFIYDGAIGYPKKNVRAEKQLWFENELLPSYDEAKATGRLAQWMEESAAKGWPTGENGEPPKWAAYAAERGWPEKNEKYTDKEITEQFWWGGGTILGALVVGVLVLLNRNKVLRGGADHFITPEGTTVRFADAFKVDTRKWDQKGLAYVWFRDGDGGKDQKAVIDDLKFGGADMILSALLAKFSGELIEKVADDEDEETDEEEDENLDRADS